MINMSAHDALIPFHVSRETMERLDIYVTLLLRWQKMLNLVAPSTLPQVWTRHIADSLQIHALAPDINHWVDLGSGGGFPGLVTAICLASEPAARVTLIESDKRKSSFLREVIRATGAPAVVISDRIEHVLPDFTDPVGAFSARALAPLPILLSYVDAHFKKGAKAYFLKGKAVDDELTEVADLSKYSYRSWPDRLQGEGTILEFWLESSNNR